MRSSIRAVENWYSFSAMPYYAQLLAPSNFHSFRSLKIFLNMMNFKSMEACKNHSDSLITQKKFWEDAFMKMPQRLLHIWLQALFRYWYVHSMHYISIYCIWILSLKFCYKASQTFCWPNKSDNVWLRILCQMLALALETIQFG